MSKYTGNYSDMVDKEVKRIASKGDLSKSEKEALSSFKETKKGKKFKKSKEIKKSNKHGKSK